MDNKNESYLIPRRNFLKEASLITGGAVVSTSVLPLGGYSSAKYTCPYCSTEAVFGNAADLKTHIHEEHAFNNVEGHVRTPIPFNISFGSIQDRVESPGVSFMSADDNIQRHIDELEKRGWPTNPTLEMPTDLTVMSDAKLKHLGDIGCEMALDVVRLGRMDRDGVSYIDQLAYVRDLKDELEQATGTQVRSARRPFSSHDKHTYAICEEVGITWYHLSPYYHYLPFQATAPFKHPEHNIVICPRPSLHLYVDAGDVVPIPDPVNAGNYFWDNISNVDHSTWHRALRHACELRLTDGTHQESRWYLNMVDPTVRNTAGLAWFTEMQSFMDWLDERVKAGLFEVMSFEKMLRMHGHGPLIDS